MSKILLIHGYGIGRNAPVLFTRLDQDGGFSLFSKLIKSNKASVFYWDIEKDFSFLQLLNPFETMRLYKSEREKATSPAVLKNLAETLKEDMPRTIICHSLGCYLFLNYLHAYSLPESIKEIVFIQGDVASNVVLHNVSLQKVLKNISVTITNIYCPWDYTLWGSAIINHYVPIGLRQLKIKRINNKLIPVSLLNTHTNGIRKSNRLLKMFVTS